MPISIKQLISTKGTGKKFMVTYGKYGGPVEVHVMDTNKTEILFGYRDQSMLWIEKAIITNIT